MLIDNQNHLHLLTVFKGSSYTVKSFQPTSEECNYGSAFSYAVGYRMEVQLLGPRCINWLPAAGGWYEIVPPAGLKTTLWADDVR